MGRPQGINASKDGSSVGASTGKKFARSAKQMSAVVCSRVMVTPEKSLGGAPAMAASSWTPHSNGKPIGSDVAYVTLVKNADDPGMGPPSSV